MANFGQNPEPEETVIETGRLVIKSNRYRAPSGQILETKQIIGTARDQQGRFVTIDTTDHAVLDNGTVIGPHNIQQVRECFWCGRLVLEWFFCECGQTVCRTCSDILIEEEQPRRACFDCCEKYESPFWHEFSKLIGCGNVRKVLQPKTE